MKQTVYQMLVNNVAMGILSEENQREVNIGKGITAFQASEVLALALCKNKEEIIQDIINAGMKFQKKS
jgi:hypothetical protein